MLGCDIVDLERIEKFYKRFGVKGVLRILSDEEYELFVKLPFRRKIEFLAGRFAAKESLIKALDKKFINFKRIAVLPTDTGRPKVYIDGKLMNFCISISHEKKYAMAVCIRKGGF